MKNLIIAFALCAIAACERYETPTTFDESEQVFEYADTTIDESDAHETYTPESENRVEAIIGTAGTVSEIITPEGTCDGFRYGSYLVPRKECKVLLAYAGDNIRSISASSGIIKNLRKDSRNNKAFYFTLDSMSKNLEPVYFSFQLNSNVAQKMERFLNFRDDTIFYGTSIWGRMLERENLGLPKNPTSAPSVITSSLIPKKGMVLYFGNREGVIVSDITKNADGKWRFKTVEWNSKCTGRKMDKSVLVADITKIMSANNKDTATRFAY
jgi:hypothetical protein